MTISLPFNSKLIVLLLLVAISMPLLEEARPLGTRCSYHHDDLGSSVLPLPQTAKGSTSDSDDAPTLLGNSGDASPSSPPDDALHRPSRRPSLSGGAGPLSASGPGVGGTRRPSAPPSPRGPKPPHWRSSAKGGPRHRPLVVHVSDVLQRVLDWLLLLLGSSSSAVHISDVVRGVQSNQM
ncbi:hypothetical protein BDA96_03G290000 [Sorghum bicolor]|uniref:Uncharacterized protein n=1 Tax=Sorghum bicolor TaxID=4558 RepID=A0A921RG38_SORBI|nr:hypothetical protein BDA96_03G290000 [Sorghum bicolor]